MFPMAVAHRVTSAVAVMRCSSQVEKLASTRPSAPQRGDLSCNAVPKWKRKNKKSVEQAPQAPRVVRERQPNNDRDDSKPSWSAAAYHSSSAASASTPTKRVPKWLKRNKSGGGQASPGTGPRPVGTMVFDVGGVATNVKRVPRWLRRAKTTGQQTQPARKPARQPAQQPAHKTENSSFFGGSTNKPSGSQRSSTSSSEQSAASSGSKRYPKWHRRYKKNPGLSPEEEFAIQRDRMAARHNWNGDRSSKATVSW